jgi:hypothetical protein
MINTMARQSLIKFSIILISILEIIAMPAKKTTLTDAERAKRIRETAREIGTDNNPEALERAFKKVVRPKNTAQDRDAEALSRSPRHRE